MIFPKKQLTKIYSVPSADNQDEAIL